MRIPRSQARALDQLAFETGRPKQEVVSELLARAIDGGRRVTVDRREDGVTVDTRGDGGLVLGHHAFRAHEPDVLTLDEVAELLGVEPARIAELAQRGELPGRRIGEAWRFARGAVLQWLARGEGVQATGGDR